MTANVASAGNRNSIKVRKRPRSGNPYSKTKLYNVGEESRKISEMIKSNTFLASVNRINEEAASATYSNSYAQRNTTEVSQKLKLQDLKDQSANRQLKVDH